MESADKYLHKKFKKQLSVEPKLAQNVEVSKSEPKRNDGPVDLQKHRPAVTTVAHHVAEDYTGRDNNESVPKYSTKHENSLSALDTLDKSSISCINIRSLTEWSEHKRILDSNKWNNDTRCEQTDQQQSSNSCISYVISKTNRVDSTSHPVAQVRPFNFDTKFNITEPNTSIPETSSILENLHSKQEDISSIKSNHDELNDKSESAAEIAEKSNPGGKYVCSYCNLACSKPSVLQKHIRAHTNERPYPCVSCGFSFKTRSNLYKHCRSRSHANRVMGNKAQEINENELENKLDYMDDIQEESPPCRREDGEKAQEVKLKPYKPRFHTAKAFFDDTVQKHPNSDLLSLHINEVINKNNAIVNSNEPYLLKKRTADSLNSHDNELRYNPNNHIVIDERSNDEPLNLTKSRKRSMSEVVEPTTQKSLIKELLLKNLYADSNMQCPYCKMIFQTVTELELHKLRNCRGFIKTGARYSRSSSVNVASIITQNKNAFDNIPHMQNTTFPLTSPGPCLGKTRLVESDKNKSFSFDGLSFSLSPTLVSPNDVIRSPHRFAVSPLSLQYDRAKKAPIKLFGGEVKITHTSGETKSFKIDHKSDRYGDEPNFMEYSGKLSENRVVKSSLQSGGTVLQNKPNYGHQDPRSSPDVIKVYENTSMSPSIDIKNLEKTKFNFDRQQIQELMSGNKNPTEMLKTPGDVIGSSNFSDVPSPSYKYTNIMDFSQKAVKLLAPNLKQPNLTIPGVPVPSKLVFPHPTSSPREVRVFNPPPQKDPDERRTTESYFSQKQLASPQPYNASYNPLNLLVNGKVVRYVPGMPGPVVADPSETAYPRTPLRKKSDEGNPPKTPLPPASPSEPEPVIKSTKMDALEVKVEFGSKLNELKSPSIRPSEMKSPKVVEMKSPSRSVTPITGGDNPRKFARPNTLALKPSVATLKQHHGLTPTVFNQILISPDTPRVAKKYVQHFLHGNYFSYLGLKSSTKSVYCTLNKTQPCYVQHFKKLSMYSEWRQQDNKQDKLFASTYDSRQKQLEYTTAGKTTADLVVHSSYKFVVADSSGKGEDNKASAIVGGYESNEEYTYIRGRGRGRYVCDQCGIRCKKPSMLKKHIRTHSNDRPYTCSHCNFSFKTKGNLTKHMKSKSHTKNYAASSSSSSSSTQQGTQSSDSDTEDSGLDSSDESTRHQEHEAAYGLLSLSQKSQNMTDPRDNKTPSPNSSLSINKEIATSANFMDSEQIAQVTNANYAKNKILDQQTSLNFSAPKNLSEIQSAHSEAASKESQNLALYLGKSNANRPLTYPYTTALPLDEEKSEDGIPVILRRSSSPEIVEKFESKVKPRNGMQCNVIQRVYQSPEKYADKISSPKLISSDAPVVKINDKVVVQDCPNVASDLRKRKTSTENYKSPKVYRNDSEVMDLSLSAEKNRNRYTNGSLEDDYRPNSRNNSAMDAPPKRPRNPDYGDPEPQERYPFNDLHFKNHENIYAGDPHVEENNRINVNYVIRENQPAILTNYEVGYKPAEYDNSAMETLADIATKQVKLEKNTLAKSVASEYLKLATKNEMEPVPYVANSKDVNDLMVKPEENKSCSVCAKSFIKPSQLRLHMNIHYLERPFRCESCSVSFRTKGHLQKHERSAGHHNKLSSSPALSSSEPRPFKCLDCNIAFRIHGHLAKHLRSKLHIMKLECLAKIPFGLYAELERSNSSLLTEINTSDGDQCLESLKALAKKVFINDPSKLNHVEGASSSEHLDMDS